MKTDLEALEARLAAGPGIPGVTLGRPLHLLAETTSTNDLAKAAARAGAPHGATWIAERQTAGRGRQGRTWISPSGEGIWMSVLLRVACPPARLPPLSLVTGLVVCDAIAPSTRVSPALKWPNDVWLAGRKVAGCLVEAQLAGGRVEALIVGVGINVRTRVFPEAIRDVATSVAIHARDDAGSGDASDSLARGRIVERLLAGLAREVPLAIESGLAPLRERIAAVDALRGARVRELEDAPTGAAGATRAEGAEASSQLESAVARARIDGVAEGIDDEGRLLVRRDGGELDRVVAGEVHLARPML